MDPDADAAAMAQAMGFSSFGAQDHHPQKRRRYNAAADSITSAHPPGPSATATTTTGSNSTPLGTPSAKPAADSEAEPPRETTSSSQEPREPPLASMPAHALAPAGRGGGSVGGASSLESHATPGRRVERRRNEPWYMGYYDGTSNENPWERLEKAMGLRTRGGIWVPRSSWTPPAMT